MKLSFNNCCRTCREPQALCRLSWWAHNSRLCPLAVTGCGDKASITEQSKHVTEQVPCSAGRAELSLKSGRVGCVSHRSGGLPGGGGCGAGRQSQRLFCVRREASAGGWYGQRCKETRRSWGAGGCRAKMYSGSCKSLRKMGRYILIWRWGHKLKWFNTFNEGSGWAWCCTLVI